MRVVIIGAGVAGCVMARRLARLKDIETICLERVGRDDHSKAGTGLNIGPNAVKVLQAIDPELTARITEAAFPWRHWRISLTDGTVLFELPLEEAADNPGWRIRWSELYRTLREAATDTIAYGCEITDIRRDATDLRKTAVAYRQDGKTHHLDGIDLLIAADGRYSQVRRLVSGDVPVRLPGVMMSRTLLWDTSNGLIDDYEQWFNGPNRLLAYRVPPNHVYIAGALPIAPGMEIDEAMKAPSSLRAAYTPRTAPACLQAAWLIDRLCESAAITHWARMQEHDVLYKACDCNVLYLGDAAHGMVPTLGQGATQAIEDAAVAAAAITLRYSRHERDVAAWLAEIEHARLDRMRFVMAFSLAASDTMLAGADPVAGTLSKNKPPFRAKLNRLYRDIDWPLLQADSIEETTA